MIKIALGVVAGLVTWFLVATAGNLAFRFGWPGYAGVEATMAFSPAMMLGRLALGTASSFCSGAVAAWIAKQRTGAAWALGIVLIGLFIPVHYRLWQAFPLWYHAAFLVSLLPLTLLGAWVLGRARAPAAPR
ncbi:MAG TPA: hypothetical protein VMQ50_12730 [Casimicrobiaceae bacterium]|nr:hypothetical protein [Casimicrobiaceae bacterium]